MAAEVGHLELAYDYFGEAAMMDLADLNHNTADGLHIASLAGSWIAAVNGFGGLRDNEGRLSFAPRLPPALSRLAFRLGWRGRLLRVVVRNSHVTYSMADGGEPLDFTHHGEQVRLEPGKPLERKVPPLVARPQPHQPPGRAPQRRR
jgi:alpha,alpha-trehalose phosphorylase